MPQRKCCVPTCTSSLIEGAVLHAFPNPSTDSKRFQTWVNNAGLTGEDNDHVFQNRRICRLHFEKICHYPKNRLSRLAVPTLHLPGVPQDATRERPLPMVVEELQPTPSTSSYSITKSVPHDATRERPLPMVVEELQPTPSTSSYSITKSVPHDATRERPLPMVVEELQPTPSTSSYSITKSVPQDATSERPVPMVVGELQPTPSTSSYSNISQRHQHIYRYEMELYKTIAKTQQALKRCKKAKDRLAQKLKIAKKFTQSQAYQLVAKNLSPAAKTFFDMQIRQSVKHPKGHRFTLDEKILALSLYKPSPKAYRLLSQICVLPKKSTLKKLMEKIFLLPGPNDVIFEHLKKRVNKMPESHKYCTIIFDEMAIAANLSYDKQNDKIKGFCDDGNHQSKCFADHALVFMVRGILKKYKQPVAFSFCAGTTSSYSLKNQIIIILKKVIQTGLKVVSVTCDQGSTNMAAINLLIKDTKEKYIRNDIVFKGGFFEIDGVEIYPIYDPPHIMKGIRNNLITKNLEYVLDGKKRTAKWSHLEALYKKGPGYKGMRLVPKLTARHVIPHLIPKMKVKYCTQVFSKTVSVAMGFTAGIGRIPQESTDTAELLLFFDRLFDSVNGNFNKIVKGKIYRSAVTPKSPHHKLWLKSLPVLKSMKFVSGRARVVPSISSWIKTIEAFQQITKKLHSLGLRSLLLRNFNQDPLENFFGAIRAHGQQNIMPNANSFEASYKALLINNMASPKSVGANCENDDTHCLQSLKYFLNQNISRPLPKAVEMNLNHLNIDLPNVDAMLDSQNPSTIEKCAAAAYCSGWLLSFIYKKLPKIAVSVKVCSKGIVKKRFKNL